MVFIHEEADMEFKDQRRMLEKMRRFDRAISKNGGSRDNAKRAFD